MIPINYRMKIYLDTSVVSYLEQEDALERMLETRKLWNILRGDKHDTFLILLSERLQNVRRIKEKS